MEAKTHFIKSNSLDIFQCQYTTIKDSRNDSLIRAIINKEDIFIKSNGDIKACDVVTFIFNDKGILTHLPMTIDYNYMVGENDSISFLLKHKINVS